MRKPQKYFGFSRGRNAENAPEGDDEKQDHPGLVNGVAVVKNESGRNRHPERRQIANGPAEERSKQKDPENGDQTGQDDRKAQGPEIAAE